MYLFVLVIQILLAICITILVLLQRSEGGMGGLAGQSANSFLTARQAGDALSRLTKWFFIFFCLATMALKIMTKNANKPQQDSLLSGIASAPKELPQEMPQELPAEVPVEEPQGE